MKNSNIEWTDHTFNPWIGCTKVSPGCVHCYAEAQNKRWAAGVNWGKGAPRRRTSADNWKNPRRWAQEALDGEGVAVDPERPEFRRLPRVFCASLADWLDDEVSADWLTDLLALVMETPALNWLLLSKRPQNWRSRLEAVMATRDVLNFHNDPLAQWVSAWLGGDPPLNVWIGTTVEDQARAVERLPHLRAIPARVRFLSCEPLLERVTIDLDGINWVICGGESGPGAREMNVDWAHTLKQQCTAAKVPFFMKQLGGVQNKGGDMLDFPWFLRVRDFPA